MTLDDKIARAKELISKREDIDAELDQLLAGTVVRRVSKCSVCQQEGHSARTCPNRPSE
jgi:hypothetical protein